MYSADEEERKAQSAARRREWLRLHKDGIDYTTRIHNPKNNYRRRPKHRPKSVDDWESD